jgi:hypothetical protein
MYRAYSGFNLEITGDNINSHNNSSDISNEWIKFIALKNEENNVLYEQAVSLLNERVHFKSLKKYWCFSFIDRLDEKAVAGVAYMASGDEPTALVIKNNGVVIGRCVANCFRSGLVQFGVPNNGFISFYFALPEKLNPTDISVEVELAGQVLQRKVII